MAVVVECCRRYDAAFSTIADVRSFHGHYHEPLAQTENPHTFPMAAISIVVQA
jgi:hypothetical protein